VVAHPAHVQYVLKDNWRNFGKGAMWRPLERLLGKSLAMTDGDEWSRSRTLLQPCFSGPYLATLTDSMASAIDAEVTRIGQQASRGPVDMTREMIHAVELTSMTGLFGLSPSEKGVGNIGATVSRALTALNLRFSLYFLPPWFPLPGDQTVKDCVAEIDELVYRVLRARRADPSGKDVTSFLLRAQAEHPWLTDQLVHDHLINLLAAGMETTGVALAWTLHLLDANPDACAWASEEVDSVLGGRLPKASDLPRLTRMKMCINEAMRVYPPAWFIPRVAQTDDSIGGYPVRAGEVVLVCPYATHRDPAVWESPEAFQPDRFSAEKEAKRPRFSFIPFGAGPRFCIGAHYSLIVGQLILAMTLQRYRLRGVRGHRVVPKAAGTLRPRDGVLMTLEQRTTAPQQHASA